jgi:hypothetical protein
MKRIRFSIASLLIVVLILAIALAALRESTDLWDSGLFSASIALLLTSVLLATYRVQERRAFWLGFALSGWFYLAASLVPQIEQRLLTTKALAYLDSRVAKRTEDIEIALYVARGHMMQAGRAITFSAPKATWESSWSPAALKLWVSSAGQLLLGSHGTTENFLRIGHTLLAFLIALLGGYFSRSLYHRSHAVATSGEPQTPEAPQP